MNVGFRRQAYRIQLDSQAGARIAQLCRKAFVVLVVCAAAATLKAQTLTTLFSFDGADGSSPVNGLVQGTDGNLYGTTTLGGLNGEGTVFKISPSGALTTIYNFCSQPNCADGAEPLDELSEGLDGNFYGITYLGGAYGGCYFGGCGTVFKITSSGQLTTLHNFCSLADCADGNEPYAGLALGPGGDFYGTTSYGGANNPPCSEAGCGTVFKITPSGTLTTLYNFCSQSGCTDGFEPQARLVQGTNGSFYGTTVYGGVAQPYPGTVFKITSTGELTTLYTFCSQTNCADGNGPSQVLIQATDGNFYSVTNGGGSSSCTYGCGTVFKMTPAGTLTTLYTFCTEGGSCPDGSEPKSGLLQATDGNLYGTTYYGGSSGDGTIFEIPTTGGTLSTLVNFDSSNGAEPYLGALLQDTNGLIYGTTTEGGLYGDGTVFGLSVGLGPFVETEPTSGNVGAPVKILGTNLVGATSVTFNGTAATFTVKSSSLITTTVPTGATTGYVQVITPHGTLKSNVVFRVKP